MLSVVQAQEKGAAVVQIPWNTPISVPTYRVPDPGFGVSGSITTSLTGVFGRSFAPGVEQFATVQLMSVQVAPPSRLVRYRITSQTAIPLIWRGGKLACPVTALNVPVPAATLVATNKAPVLAPA